MKQSFTHVILDLVCNILISEEHNPKEKGFQTSEDSWSSLR